MNATRHIEADERPDGVRFEQKTSIPAARALLEQARYTGQAEEIAVALIRLGQLYFRQARYDPARQMADEVLCVAPQDSWMRCDAIRLLGNCAAELGDPDSAEHLYHQAADLARELDDRYGLYKCLHSLATNIYWPRGQFNLCLAAGQEALAQARALDLGEELWFPLSDLAWAYWYTGQRQLARKVAEQMQQVVSQGSLGDGFTSCLRAGLADLDADHLDDVVELFARARSIAEATGDPGLNIEVRVGLCRSYRAVGELAAAMAWAEDAVAVSERLSYRQFLALALIERGRTALEAGDQSRAEHDLRAALDLAGRLRSAFDVARASLYLAALLSRQHSPEAPAVLDQAVNTITSAGYDFLIEQERGLILPWVATALSHPDPAIARASAVLFDRLCHLTPLPLRVTTLGGFSIQVGAASAPRDALRQRRAGELFALLLTSPGRTLSAEQVTEAMCPEKDPQAALDFYHHAISALRHLLEPDLPDRRFPCRYLDVSESRVTLLIPPGSAIDCETFEQHIRHRAWADAIATYSGEYLPLFAYAEWTLSTRQHLADQYEQALLAQADERLKAGDAPACLELARRAVRHNAWQEQAVELGMRAALELGDRATAIRLYRRLEKQLSQDLGIAPQSQLQILYEAARKRRAFPTP